MQVNTYDPNNPLSTTGADPNIYQQLPSQNRFGTSHIPGQSTANASAAMDLMCPAFDRPDAEKIAWLQGSVARGRNFLSQQPVAPFIDLATKILMGMEVEGDGGMVQKDGTPSKRRSTSRINEISRMILEVVDNMHNLKPKWFYEMLGGDVDANKKFQQVVNQMNARLAVWWTGSTFPATKIKEALQQAATASGYLIPVWTKELFGSGDEDVELKVAGPQDVIPDGITDDWDLQKAQAVHIYERCPTARLRALWWEQAQFILPTTPLGADNSVRGNGMLPSGMRGFMNFASSSLFSALGMSGFASDKQATTGMGRMVQTKLGLTSFPVTDLYISYLQDSTVNTSGRVVWANEFTRTDTAHGLNLVRDYPVPPNGVPVRIHNSEEAKTNPYFSDDQSSLRHPKQYTYTDCMLYPTRRMLIWTVDRVLYDGPNFDHHGQVPAIKIDLRHWTWSYLGTGLVRQNISPQIGRAHV